MLGFGRNIIARVLVENQLTGQKKVYRKYTLPHYIVTAFIRTSGHNLPSRNLRLLTNENQIFLWEDIHNFRRVSVFRNVHSQTPDAYYFVETVYIFYRLHLVY